MKKLLLLFAAVAALSFVSCDNNANKNENGADSTADTLATAAPEFDAAAFDKLLVDAQDEAAVTGAVDDAKAQAAAKLAAGDTTGYFSIMNAIKDAIEKNKEILKTKAASVVEGAKDLVPAELQAVAEKYSAAAAAAAAVSEAKDAAVDAAGAVKDAAAEKVDKAVDKVADKAAEVKDKAKEEAGKAVDKAAATAKDKLGL